MSDIDYQKLTDAELDTLCSHELWEVREHAGIELSIRHIVRTEDELWLKQILEIVNGTSDQ